MTHEIELRVCPICGHGYCLQLCVVGGLGNPTNITAMVKCASCGEVRHWSHWKTPAEHAAADSRVKAFSEAIASGEEPKDAVDRIFNE